MIKAISIYPGRNGSHIIEREEPSITTPFDVKVLQVGICGTDREEVKGGRVDPQAGKNYPGDLP